VYGTRPVEMSVPFAGTLVPGTRVRPPLGYLIPVQWGDLAERLRLHGVPVERLDQPVTGTFEIVRFADVAWPEGPFEGRHMPTFRTERAMEPDTFPAGSFWVPLGNPTARLAMHLLEPDGPDSFASWGFLNAIFEAKEYAEDYVMEEVARTMMEKDRAVKEAFEAKVAADTAFRADPAARLEFFYRRTPFWDERKDRYPVARVFTPFER
nr:peptidase M14 [Gemmatimonadota bacterium]